MNITYKSGSRLERVLRSGRFAVTAELNPPDSADPQEVYDAAVTLAAVCDAINAPAAAANCPGALQLKLFTPRAMADSVTL